MLPWWAWAIAACWRSRTALVAENLCLRQQLLVLRRRQLRPRLSDRDRRFWILASRWFPGWQDILVVVSAATVLRWHRRGWRAYWRWRSRRGAKAGRHAIAQELQVLIRRMAAEKSIVGTAKDPSRIDEARVQSVCQNRRQVHATTHASKAITGLAVIPEARRSDHLGV
jgi:hypothetical protein